MRALVVAGLVVSGCAPALKPAAVSAPPAAIANAQAQMVAMQQARLQAEKSCAFLKTLEPDAKEERLIGALIAGQQLKANEPLFLDPSVENERTRIMQELDKGALESLPAGPRGSVTGYVAEVGQKLAKVAPRPELKWTFGVVKSDAERTFSMPGGFVFITTGLLKKVNNEAQLAGLLGHEMGHVVKKHQLHAYRDARAELCFTAKTMSVALATAMPGSETQLQAVKYAERFQEPLDLTVGDDFARWLAFSSTTMLSMNRSSEQEFESDRAALELLGATDYAAVEFETILAAVPKEGFGPDPAARVAKLQALREGELKPFLKGKAKPDASKALAPLRQ